MARTKGSKNKVKREFNDWVAVKAKRPTPSQRVKELEKQLERANEVASQAQDYITDLEANVDFYRKQVNHFLALVNILARGK
ncbi:coiled-coil domain-containing protein [Bacteriophage sp.]|nr:coiled-coil domain-containing protein [Bacteriophage sp.]